MNANMAKVQSLIENAFTSAVEKLAKDESGNFISDLYVQADAESGEQANEEETQEKDDSQQEEVKVSGDPQVIIYHTHSTESYMPYKESNYHRTVEEGTVRDVGNVLETELKKRGINVIHDKTVHDNNHSQFSGS